MAVENDYISRQAAIRAVMTDVMTEKTACLIHANMICKRIEDLPSAEPVLELDEWCMDCKEYDHEKNCCPRFNRVIKSALKDAEPERKKGKWERHYSRPNVYADLAWHCSACGYASLNSWANKYTFCPNCGADMRDSDA